VNLKKLPPPVRLTIEAMQNKKASGITVLDLSSLGTFTEYFVLCTGFSAPQVQAICGEVEEQLYKELRTGRYWILADSWCTFSANRAGAFTTWSACGETFRAMTYPTCRTPWSRVTTGACALPAIIPERRHRVGL
jgi:hypothetical protein